MSQAEVTPVFVGIRGTVLALNRKTGKEMWRTTLKGGGFVNLVSDEGDLLATTKGEVFCLDRATGRIRWNNSLKGMGFGLATIATPNGSSKVVMAEQLRQEAAAAASAG